MGLHQIYQLAIAIGLGLLVGWEREESRSPIAGIRTFSLITAFGLLTGILARPLGPGVAVGGLFVVAGFMVLGNLLRAQKGKPSPGMTSEFASVVMFCAGLAVSLDWNALAVALAGTVFVLLHSKEPMRAFARRFGPAEQRALVQLVLVGFILLPAMPDVNLGPYGVLNPREIWLMVVLIVGISLGAYVLYRLLGGRAGSVLGGVLGGLISSTASTLTFSRLASTTPGISPGAAVMILLASTVVFGRVVLEVAVVSPGQLRTMAPPLLTMMGIMAAVSYLLYRRNQEGLAAPAPEDPPSDLRSAVAFGALYAVILVAVAFARARFGEGGLFLVSALSGLTDMDAITLSSAQLVDRGQLAAGTAWRMILVGGISNLAFKAGVVVSVGPTQLRSPVLSAFGASALAGVGILLFWPG